MGFLQADVFQLQHLHKAPLVVRNITAHCMKSNLCFILLIFGYFNAFCQDSTELPKNPYRNTTITEYTFHSIKYVPKYLTDALDSVYGRHLKIYENGERVNLKSNIPEKDQREFRALTQDRKAWLMTYVHWEGKRHIHFIVFTMKNNQVIKITTGTSEYDIDSISTIERLKGSNQIKFINIHSKTNLHKF